MSHKPLDNRPPHKDLMYHEIRLLLASLVGGLVFYTDPETRTAVKREFEESISEPDKECVPIRRDLSDLDCTNILAGLLGGLVQMAPIENVRNALLWWAEQDQLWPALEKLREMGAQMLDHPEASKGAGN